MNATREAWRSYAIVALTGLLSGESARPISDTTAEAITDKAAEIATAMTRKEHQSFPLVCENAHAPDRS